MLREKKPGEKLSSDCILPGGDQLGCRDGPKMAVELAEYLEWDQMKKTRTTSMTVSKNHLSLLLFIIKSYTEYNIFLVYSLYFYTFAPRSTQPSIPPRSINEYQP